MHNIMAPQTLLRRSHALVPLARWRVFTEKNKADSHEHNQNPRNNKAHPPRLVTRQPITDKCLVNSRHDKIRNPTTEIPQSTSQRIRSAHDILVKESRGPDLARHEATAQNADEEAQRIQTRGIIHCASKEGRHRTSEQAAGEREPGAEVVTRRAGDEAHDECRSERDNVAVCDFVLFHANISRNDVGEEGREGCSSQ
jgi:hypothetical protein